MSIKKPSELFNKSKSISVVGNVIDKEVGLNSFSSSLEQFKSTLKNIETLSAFSESLGGYTENIQKINIISEYINDIKVELKSCITKEDLEKSSLAQLLVVEQCIEVIEEKIEAINQDDINEIKFTVEEISSKVNSFLDVDAPKYKKLVIESESRTRDRFDDLKTNVNDIIENISNLVDVRYSEILDVVDGANEVAIDEIFDQFNKLQEEIPNYRNFIVESELKNEKRILRFQKILDETVEAVNDKVDSIEGITEELTQELQQKIQSVNNFVRDASSYIKEIESHKAQIKEKVTELESQIIVNESHINKQNKHIDSIQEEVYLTIQKLNFDVVDEKNYELSKKIKYLEEIFEKFNEQRVLNENILTEPPTIVNKDPLTPIAQNYVTLEQLQQHYRLFINRVQQQLATIGGGGETRLRYLDDIVGIATNPSAYDQKFLKYNHPTGTFEFTGVSEGLVPPGGDPDAYLVKLSIDDFDYGWKPFPSPIAVPDLSNDNPQPLGISTPGTSGETSRSDHVHAMPAIATTSTAGLRVATSFAAIGYASSVTLDMAALDQQYRTISLTGALTFTTSNRAAGRMMSLRLICDATGRALTFPAGWVFVGTKPSTIAASKVAVLSLTFYGTADTDCIAAYSVQT
jgi:hypothetical protein